jgi:hypothetical protein
MNPAMRKVCFGLAASIWLGASGCSSAYYGALEKVGIPKREVMVHRVEKARDSQQEAKEQFKSALERFTALTRFQGGNLQEKYDQLQKDFDTSQAKADDVHRRIADIEDVSEALFGEWETELGQYSNPSLRRSSEQKLRATRQRYQQMIAAMKKAESRIAPVLDKFRDQVLFLKHNLNAQAIASLQNEVGSVETNVSALIREMEASIREADGFIQNMGKGS